MAVKMRHRLKSLAVPVEKKFVGQTKTKFLEFKQNFCGGCLVLKVIESFTV